MSLRRKLLKADAHPGAEANSSNPWYRKGERNPDTRLRQQRNADARLVLRFPRRRLRHEARYDRLGLCCPRPATQRLGDAGGSPVSGVRAEGGGQPPTMSLRLPRPFGGCQAGAAGGLARRLSRAAGGEVFGRSRSPPPVSGPRACCSRLWPVSSGTTGSVAISRGEAPVAIRSSPPLRVD
jgi:hypothetical protein